MVLSLNSSAASRVPRGFGIYSLVLKKDFKDKGSIGLGAKTVPRKWNKIRNEINSVIISQNSTNTLRNMNFKINQLCVSANDLIRQNARNQLVMMTWKMMSGDNNGGGQPQGGGLIILQAEEVVVQDSTVVIWLLKVW